MKLKKISLVVSLLISALSFSQSINYKALVKDDNGNVIANDLISVQFIIYQGAALTNNVYQELHTPTTDNNGLFVVNIGEGTTSDIFSNINWSSEDHFLNVQINTGTGLIDLGTTQFRTVPYAKVAENVTGLEAIDEGNGMAWRLKDKNPDNYGNLGDNAIDLSESQVVSTEHGATGNYSIAMGINTTASGLSSFAGGIATDATGNISFAMGSGNEASGDFSTAFGSSSTASGNHSTVFGLSNQATGNFSTAIGRDLTTNYHSTSIGRYNVGGGNATFWSNSDPLFEIGNGISNTNRSNALTVYKGGFMRLNSSDNGLLIDSNEQYGIYVPNGNLYGGYFEGSATGIYSDALNSTNPDIILGGEDGIIASNTSNNVSDIFLRANNNVYVDLDDDGTNSSFFLIRNSEDSIIALINESGDLTLDGQIRIGNETIENTGSNQLSADASLIPTTNNAFRLGNSSNRWIGVWATDGTINTSDRREKKNIEDLNYGLAEVLQMQPKSFNWKNKNIPDTKLGLIAQDLKELVPEVVKTHTWEKDEVTGVLVKKELDRLGVYYSDLVPVLIKAIQEQQTQITALKSKLQHKGKINQEQSQLLKSLLDRVEAIEQSNN